MANEKNRTKHRVLRMLLSLALVVGLLPALPAIALADDVTGAGAADLGSVHVTVENATWSKADGAPWEGMLVDTQVALKENSTMMSCIVDALPPLDTSRKVPIRVILAPLTALRKWMLLMIPVGWARLTIGSLTRALPITPLLLVH